MPVYVIFPRHKKLAHATLNIVSIFRLSILIGLSDVIFSRISFVIGKRVTFCLEKSLFPPLMISTMQGMLKALRLK